MTDKEINELVAKKMGWGTHVAFPGGWVPPDGVKKIEEWVVSTEVHTDPPDYANDIKAAWEVVEHLCVNYGIHLSRDTEGYAKNEWRLYISTGPIEGPSAYASTAPRAICEAFLKLP